ncbi:MAG TPA: TIGR03943 family protein [Jatrophihabitans sp.]
MNTRTQGFLLLLFGGALLRIGVSDLLLRYVRPAARPWVILAGFGLLILALAQLVSAHRQRAAHEPTTRTGWLILAPVLAMVVIAPPALGAFSASRTPSQVHPQNHKEFSALTGSDPHRLALFDFTTRILWDGARSLNGVEVELTGFVLSQRPDGFVLARLVITCCAADARPIEVVVHTTQHPVDDSWVATTGRYVGTDPAAPTLPILAATSISSVTEPRDPYE